MRTYSSNSEKLNAAIAGIISLFTPPEDITVSQWADKNRYVSQESAAEPGPWRTSRTPYLQEPMDAFTDYKIKLLVLVAAAQIGKTEFELNSVAYAIDQDPGSMLYIHPTLDDARKFSKLRIAPMVRDCKALRSKVKDAKSRDSGNTILQKSFPGGMLTICGSNSASGLSSTPVRYVIGDELDRWAVSAGTEGSPWELAKARQTAFYNAKSIAVSTPTIKGHSAIEDLFTQGTQERWHHQCPDCGEYHNICFADIRFEYDTTIIKNKKYYNVKSVLWVCPSCGCVHTEKQMRKQPAKWVAENPAAYQNGVRSFWLNAFSSPWVNWSELILAYLEALGDTRKLQVVYNTKFGELWEDRGDIDDEETIMGRRETYEAELPDGVLVLTCGVDTQDDRLEYEVVGHGHFGEKWGIKRGVIMGRPDTAEVWAALDDIIDHKYSFANGVTLKISTTFVDSGGHYTQDVYAACRERFYRKVFAIKGRGGEGVPYTSPAKQTNIIIRGTYIGQCWLYTIGVDSGKQSIMDSLKVRERGAKYYHFPKNEDCGYDMTFFAGLLSERLVYKQGRQHPWVWEKIPGHERNEALDCRNYANAAFKATAADLDAIASRLKDLASGKKKKNIKKQVPQSAFNRNGGSFNNKFYDEW
jgi:phage terminase large subunit GpA-like protein